MNGTTFGEKLKTYRAQKRYTQQQLAELLGVSDKTVSKWECGGGLPDVALLVPLARALGVTVDDLLDGGSPLRQLQKQDWQNFLAFAFSLGGGLLFFLVCTFAPALLGYFLYLGCLAYGAYLQRYYCYKTRWFTRTGAAMLALVNASCSFKLALLVQTGGMLSSAIWMSGGRELPLESLLAHPLGLYLAMLALAAVLTLGEALLLQAYLAGRPLRGALRQSFSLQRPRRAQLWPCVGLLVQVGFISLYGFGGLPSALYVYQKAFFWLVTGVCWLPLAWMYRKRGQMGQLALATAFLAAGRLLLTVGAQSGAWNRMEGHLLRPELFSDQLSKEIYVLFSRPGAPAYGVAAALLAGYLALCCVRVRPAQAAGGGAQAAEAPEKA